MEIFYDLFFNKKNNWQILISFLELSRTPKLNQYLHCSKHDRKSNFLQFASKMTFNSLSFAVFHLMQIPEKRNRKSTRKKLNDREFQKYSTKFHKIAIYFVSSCLEKLKRIEIMFHISQRKTLIRKTNVRMAIQKSFKQNVSIRLL